MAVVIVPPRHTLPRARDLVAAARRGELDVVATATATLERIAALDPELRAFVAVDEDAVMARARELDAVGPTGALHGVPVALKDIIDTRDLPTEYGSPIHAGHRPAADATVVTRLRAAGALIVGKTVTAELAQFTPGPTRNPHDLERTPGGSSSGSAAAVAAGLVPLALGTQTAGSVVRPASFCGIVGVKPTFGLVPFDGVKVCSGSLDTLGVMALDVEDAALALAVMVGSELDLDRGDDLGAAAGPSRPLRIGWWPGATAMDPAAAQVVEAAVSALRRRADVELVAVDLPGWFAELVEDQTTLMHTESVAALTDERLNHADLLSPALRERLASPPDPEGAARALARRPVAQRELAQALDGLDGLLTPSVLGEAPELAVTGDPALCRTWTLLGVPAVAVPGLTGPAGLPLGVQVVGPVGDDLRVLRAARRVMALLADAGVAAH
jgi:Asp-tRNA(Asn)/Glu-tRNA(Gln) amidotransferase A subunit family amidase